MVSREELNSTQRPLYPLGVVWRFTNELINIYLSELSYLYAQLSNFQAACPFFQLQYK